MSLRQSPRPTPQQLDAAHHNAQHSTGPRSPAGKQNSKMNALQHGERADPENHYEVMCALGEDPQEFENLKQELRASFGPAEALWERQIDDLARLYWRRDRLERAQAALLRRAWQEVEDWQEQRRREMAGATFDSPRAVDLSLSPPTDPGVRLRMLLSFLSVIRAQVKQRIFKLRQESQIAHLYQEGKGWRQARLCHLLWLFSEAARSRRPQEEELEEAARKAAGWESAGPAPYQELLRLLDEEIASVEEQFQHAEVVNEEKVAIEREACLAPEGEEWKMLLRREETLDRAIDRKVRILLSLRKTSAAPQKPQARTAVVAVQGFSAGPTEKPPGLANSSAARFAGADQAGDSASQVPRVASEVPRVAQTSSFISASLSVAPPSPVGQGASSGHVPCRTVAEPGHRPAAAVNQKMNERSRNVTENKEGLW